MTTYDIRILTYDTIIETPPNEMERQVQAFGRDGKYGEGFYELESCETPINGLTHWKEKDAMPADIDSAGEKD